jgi:hypothetical protein
MNTASSNPALPRSYSPLLKYLWVTIIFFLMGCDNPEDKPAEDKTYYDVKGFIETQIVYLAEQKPTVHKKMSVAGKNEDRTTKEVDWKKELELFVQADINKPAYRKSYSVTKPDSLTTLYTLQPTENLPVQYLKVQVDKITGNPTAIQALLRSENKLYRSEKHIEMHCASQANQWRLTDYAIKGYQKLAMTDQKDFDIKAAISY